MGGPPFLGAGAPVNSAGAGAFLRRAEGSRELIVNHDHDESSFNTFGSGESGESKFIEHGYESPCMQRMAQAVQKRNEWDKLARYTSDNVYPHWILDHAHFEEAKHLVKTNRLRDALQNSPKERTDEDVEVLTAFLMNVWPTTLRLGEARVQKIAQCANLRRFHQDQYIVTEGEVGLTFYIIVSGTADVYKQGANDSKPLVTLGTGHSFGEASLGVGAPPRNASCVASSTTTELLELRKTDFDKIMKSYQDAEQRRAFRCLKNVPMFRSWAKSRLTRLCGLVRRVDFRAGAMIIKQNDPPDNVYFVLEGSCAVVKTIEIRTQNRWPTGIRSHNTTVRCAHKLVPLIELGPGTCFGERGILHGERRKATVTATTDVILLALDKVEFEALLQRTTKPAHAPGTAHSEHRHHLTDDEIASALASVNGEHHDPAPTMLTHLRNAAREQHVFNDEEIGRAHV